MQNSNLSIIKEAIRTRMQEASLSDEIITQFLAQVEKVHNGASGKINWEDLAELEKEDSISLEEINHNSSLDSNSHSKISKYLSSLVVIKLNGGLGTNMGLSQAKTLIPIRGKKNFLELICQQIEASRQEYKSPLPVLFMNSFSTQKDTLENEFVQSINSKIGNNFPLSFLQNKVPRLYQKNLLPVAELEQSKERVKSITKSNSEAWCPSGHGDVFFSLKSSGLLEKLLDFGYKTAFISNGDNLGAVPDTNILRYFHEEKLEWISEITDKRLADKKGGILFRNKSKAGRGKIQLLERAQVPEEHLKDFEDLSRFGQFNINNLWVDLRALSIKLRESTLELSLIINPKILSGIPILQLETAMGAAIAFFDKSRVVSVPRDRFAPVKACSDLLVLRSDAYSIEKKTKALVPKDKNKIPLVTLSDSYKNLFDFEKLFFEIPSLKDATHLEIDGPLLFDVPIKITGDVSFQAKDKDNLKLGQTKLKRVSEFKKREFKNENIIF